MVTVVLSMGNVELSTIIVVLSVVTGVLSMVSVML